MTVDVEELRKRQAPLKERYRKHPSDAVVTMSAQGQVDIDAIQCHVSSATGETIAGLHPAAGGSGKDACSGDMLLQALVACSGVTLAAVATAMRIPLRRVTIVATGKMDFRGTLGLDRNVPIGITDLDLQFTLELDDAAEAETLDRLLELTERYCVVLQTLKTPPNIQSRWTSVA